MSDSPRSTPSVPPAWVYDMADEALNNARRCEREARRLRKAARTMLAPPPGVRIEYAGPRSVNVLTEVRP